MSSATATKPPLGFRIRSWLGDNALRFYAVIAFIYLLLPVAYTFAFSFNNAGTTGDDELLMDDACDVNVPNSFSITRLPVRMPATAGPR